MEKERHLLRPWPERMMTSAPLLAPALAMLCACAAVDVSPWFWACCACWVLLPCLFRMPVMSLPALALAVWAGGCLLDYGRQYGNLAVEEGGRFAAEGSVDAVSGRSVLFRPHGARWLYTVSAREGGLPLEPGKRYRIEGCLLYTSPSPRD